MPAAPGNEIISLDKLTLFVLGFIATVGCLRKLPTFNNCAIGMRRSALSVHCGSDRLMATACLVVCRFSNVLVTLRDSARLSILLWSSDVFRLLVPAAMLFLEGFGGLE